MNLSPAASKSETSLVVDDQTFAKMVKAWIAGFHGEVAKQSEAALETRVKSYIKQEDLYDEKVRFVLSLLPRRPQTALDIGSSAGGLSVALARQGLTVQGIEPSEAGVNVSKARAARLGIDTAFFQVGVGEKIPFPDASFDLVVSIAVLEHVQDVCAVVSETFRVLKPGGHAYFEVPNNLFPFEGHYKMVWLPMMPKSLGKLYVKARGAYPSFLDHLHYMNRFIVKRRFAEAGFINIKDLYGDFLCGKCKGEAWATKEGRLAKWPWAAPLIRLVFGPWPSAWFCNRAVFLIAQKPEAQDHG
jgi:2-polyprenyl-3-methyl-5-hydroxy-6-metoxy-1,4-benzoquinol methylase